MNQTLFCICYSRDHITTPHSNSRRASTSLHDNVDQFRVTCSNESSKQWRQTTPSLRPAIDLQPCKTFLVLALCWSSAVSPNDISDLVYIFFGPLLSDDVRTLNGSEEQIRFVLQVVLLVFRCLLLPISMCFHTFVCCR